MVPLHIAMASATDIITYIGVPLAVLGVMPILYTFMLAILTQRRIRASLIHHGHTPVNSTRQHDGFTIRSSPMTSLIEVELPRYAIAPLERTNQDYWKATRERQELDGEHHRLLDRAESTLSMVEEGRVRGYLRGGSWRAFHWKKLIVGKKLYRIQYEDELREPPAEIDFSELVHFLLDWGAVPDSMGWEKLRSGGLWTPAGTVLLRQPENDGEAQKKHVDWILRTSMPDESDGILNLTIKWNKDSTEVGQVRGVASLPPGWGRLNQPAPLESNDKVQEDRKDLSARIEELKTANKHSLDSTSFRFRLDGNYVQKVLWEQHNIETGFVDEPFRTHEQSAGGMWFTSAMSAILAQKQSAGGMWAFDLPSDVASFVRRDSVPWGVMVLLGLSAEIDAPHWSSEQDVKTVNLLDNPATRHHERFLASQAAARLEATMPPDQARIHKMNREAQERQERHNDMMREISKRQEREERRMQEAMASPRMNHKAVAEACLAWLIAQGDIGREWTVGQLAEAVLYLMVIDQREDGEGRKVVRVLEEWMSWATAGGMKKQQVIMLGDMKVEFCLAASLVAMIQELAATGLGKAGADMLECLQLWRKVRLG